MRLNITRSKNSECFYVIKDIINPAGKRTTVIIEALGNLDEVKRKAGEMDYKLWLKQHIDTLNRLEKDNNRTVSLNLNPKKEIASNQQRMYDGGYLFLKSLYYQLGLSSICSTINKKYKFEYDLNNILETLIYARVIHPASKLSSYQASKKFIERPNFELHDIYRALEVLCKESDYIQSALYRNSEKLVKRNTSVIYFDCTNYYFEIDEEDGLKQYGVSKENRPNPIVQMGLFMDSDGIPLLFSIHPSNMNEQGTLQPTEKKLLRDFAMSKFIVCTDAGLASSANRRFNDTSNRAFVTTQSVKKLKKYLKEWAFSSEGWHLINDNKTYNIKDLDKHSHSNDVFYKERWINENNIEQRLLITYSVKYRNYQRNIRNRQVDRAIELISSNPKRMEKVRQNDYKRFITKTALTESGEVADTTSYTINQEQVESESKYDGLYALCTNLEDSAETIINISRRRWEIEESFRIMKDDLETRPIYLSKDDRIVAHFLTCFLALVIYRYLEKKLNFNLDPNQQYTVKEIIKALKSYKFIHIPGDGYIPLYTKSDITDKLHQVFGFKTDYEIVSEKKMKNICRNLKK